MLFICLDILEIKTDLETSWYYPIKLNEACFGTRLASNGSGLGFHSNS